MPPDPEVTLRDFVEFRFAGLEKKVESLERKFETLEDCISNDVQHAIKMWRYIGGAVVAIVMALIIAWLRQALGL